MLVGFHCYYRNGKEKKLVAFNREESDKLENAISKNRAIEYCTILRFSDIFSLSEWAFQK